MLKSLFVFFILSSFLYLNITFAKVTITNSDTVDIYDVDVERVDSTKVTIEGRDFFKLNLVGVDGHQAIYYKEGYPEIPVVRFYTYADEVVVQMMDKYAPGIQELNLDVVPSLESLPKIPGAIRKLKIDKSFNMIDDFWPKSDYLVEDVGQIQGKMKKMVTLFPVKYNPVSRSYKLINNFHVELKKVTAAKSADANIPKKEIFAFIIGNQFRNNLSLNNYVKFKEQLGYQVEKIIIGDEVNTPEDIRLALQNLLHREGSVLKYALIVGDSQDVPAKEATHMSGVTDHYYRAIDTDDYQDDINGPDIGVGRITVNNDIELNAVLKKLEKYQRGEFADNSWLKNISFIATNDKYLIAEGSHNFAVENYTKDHGYTGVFPEQNMEGGDKLYAITYRASDAKVVETMKLGRTIINYSGHGSTRGWAGPNVTQQNVKTLNHGDALPFVISNACITGQFTIDESFGETWIKHPNGAIMFWGSMDSTYWDEDDILEKGMYQQIFQNNQLHFVDITSYALSEHWKYFGGQGKSKYYWETYVTFGDPSIRLRTDITKNGRLLGPDVLPYGVDSVTYKVVDDLDNPVIGARVALNVVDGGNISSGLTDSFGMITLPFSENLDSGNFSVLVYGDNLKMTSRRLDLVASNSPFFLLSEYKVNGRSDGRLSANEDVNVDFNIANVSSTSTVGGKIIMEIVQGPAVVVQPQAEIPAIDANGRISHSDSALQFNVSENAQDGDNIVIRFNWQSFEGGSGSTTTTFTVSRAKIEFVSLKLGEDLNGGIPTDGEGEVFITIKNNGSAPLLAGSMVAEVGECVRDISGYISYENLLPGAVATLATPVKLHLDGSCVGGEQGSFNLNATSERESFVLGIPFTVGVIERVIFEQARINLKIPDSSSVEFPFEISDIRRIQDLTVHLKVTHTYVGDLTISLVHPSGLKIILRDKIGGAENNIDENYGINTGTYVHDLKKLIGTDSSGEWKLRIEDNASSDTGVIDYLKVELKGYKP